MLLQCPPELLGILVAHSLHLVRIVDSPLQASEHAVLSSPLLLLSLYCATDSHALPISFPILPLQRLPHAQNILRLIERVHAPAGTLGNDVRRARFIAGKKEVNVLRPFV